MLIFYLNKKKVNDYINYLIISLAFVFPLSKALINFIEIMMILLWIYQGNFDKKLKLLKSQKFIIFLGLFLIYNILSIFWSSNILFSIKYLSKFHHFLIIPIIYTSLEYKYVKKIIFAYVLGVFISELISYGIYFNLFTYGSATHQFPTPFMHHITYSVVLVFTSMILLINFLKEKRLWYKIFEFIFLTTIITNLFINGGRTGQVIFIFAVFIVLSMYVKQKIKAFIISSLIVLFTFTMAYNFSHNFYNRVNQIKNGLEKVIYKNDYTDQGGMRLALWIIGSKLFWENPIIGTGIDNVMKNASTYVSKQSFKVKDLKSFADYHNVFINIAIELGLVGLILIILIFYYLFKLSFKIKEYKVLNIVFVVCFILFSFTHNTFHLMFPMVFFSLFSGFFSGISRIETSKKLIKKDIF